MEHIGFFVSNFVKVFIIYLVNFLISHEIPNYLGTLITTTFFSLFLFTQYGNKRPEDLAPRSVTPAPSDKRNRGQVLARFVLTIEV